MQSIVGSYIGLYSPWGGNFQGSGCCDDVLIDCYSKCVHFIEGECKNIDGITDNDTETRAKSPSDHWVTIQPIPAFSGQSVELNFSELPQSVEIFNSTGVMLKMVDCCSKSMTYSTVGLFPGLYYLQTKFSDITKINKFIIH